MARILVRLALASLPLALLSPSTGRAGDAASVARALLDLSPERVAAFNDALREFSGTGDETGADLYFRLRYGPATDAPPSCLRDSPDGIGEVRVPLERDVTFLENFYIQGREDEYEHAARRWVGRALKGSDAAGRAATESHRWQPRADWNDGPVIGFRRGAVTATAGWNSDWRIRVSRPMRKLPGWTWRTWIGERDGETIAGFTIGRSLYASR